VSAPALVIVFEIEAPLRVLSTAVTEGEQQRLEDALRHADDDVRELLERAFTLVGEAA
jgi:hypothetical protein